MKLIVPLELSEALRAKRAAQSEPEPEPEPSGRTFRYTPMGQRPRSFFTERDNPNLRYEFHLLEPGDTYIVPRCIATRETLLSCARSYFKRRGIDARFSTTVDESRYATHLTRLR